MAGTRSTEDEHCRIGNARAGEDSVYEGDCQVASGQGTLFFAKAGDLVLRGS